MCQITAERRGLPVSVVSKEVERAIQKPTPEPVEGIAERIVYRRQVTMSEVLTQVEETVRRANNTIG